MKLPYRRYLIEPSPLNPSGILYEPRIKVHALGPAGVGVYWALLDTGANNCVMPESEAAMLGVSLDGADEIVGVGFTGAELTMRLASVDFQISDGKQSFQWSAPVAFAPFADPEDEIVILGHVGCLDYFRATFDGDAHELELVPTPGFPGTVT